MGVPLIMPVWFGAGHAVSNTADLSLVGSVIGLITPATWTPAVVSILGSVDGTTFFPMYDGMTTTLLTFTIPPGAIIAVNRERVRCCSFIRLVSGTLNAPVQQIEAREFILLYED